MINLYFKNFNFNLSCSIGVLISSALEKENFIKKIEEFKLDYKLYSFKFLKTNFDFKGKIISPLNFPFKNINKLFCSKLVILEDVKIDCLWDAALFNAICDFVLNNAVILCIKTESDFNVHDIFFSYLNYGLNSPEHLILDIYKSHLILLTETRIIKDIKCEGYTSSMYKVINKISILGFHNVLGFNQNYDKPYILFSNDKKLKIKLNIASLNGIYDLNGEFIGKKGIIVNTNLTDIYFHKDELIDKIKIFLGAAANAREPFYCRRKGIKINKNVNNIKMRDISQIQDMSKKEIFFPNLVIAGAGSGKTRIIVNKFLYLLNFISSDSIVILTFTNNAADEIRNRIASSLPVSGIYGNFNADKILNISTYHSFFYSIIKEFYMELGFKYPPLIKDNNNEILDKSNKDYISYDEIIMKVIELLKNNDILLNIASRFKYILIDEYQDLDFYSDYIIKKIDSARGAVMYSGDDDQAIYGFNGGDSFNILFFDLFYPSGKIFVMQNNYRSHYKIIEFCNSIIDKIGFRYSKKLTSEKVGNEKCSSYIINIIQLKNKKSEEQFIIKTAGRFINEGKTAAILVRTQKEEIRFKTAAYANEVSYIGTIHKSKGMEFDIIFIANASSGNIPNLKSIPDIISRQKRHKHPFVQFLNERIELHTEMDDEIKLFYVAVSRAKEKVFITYSGKISEFLTY